MEVQPNGSDRVLYDTSKGGKTEIALMKNGKCYKDGAEVDPANLKAKIGDTEITNNIIEQTYEIGPKRYMKFDDMVYEVPPDEYIRVSDLKKEQIVTDQTVLDKIKEFEKQFEWINELTDVYV